MRQRLKYPVNPRKQAHPPGLWFILNDQTAETHRPVVISGKRANAVLVSEEDWSAIQETLYLLATPGMRESIKDAMSEPISKSKKALKW